VKVYQYKDYDEYVNSQIEACRKKHENVWVNEENIKFLAEYILTKLPLCRKGLCHGVRQGLEQLFFMKYLKSHFPDYEVIGTEIGVTDAEYTVIWDFNKVNNDWQNKFDFIYSNSFDHAFNPEKTINVWAGQVGPGGLIILESDQRNEHTGEISKKINRTDPVSVRIDELIKLVPKWVPGAKIKDVLPMPVINCGNYQKSIIIEVP